MKIPSRWVARTLPFGLLGFVWLGMRTNVRQGSEAMHSYGFPFQWYAPDPTSSLAYTIALVPLAIDLTVYLAAATLLLRMLAPPSAGNIRRASPGGWLAWLVWLVAAGSLAFTLAVIGADLRFVAWDLEGYFGPGAQRDHGIQLGPGR